MVEIKAGAELDRAVAEAAGYDATIYYSHDLEKNVCLLLPSEESFSPSVDLNYAFAAAEKAFDCLLPVSTNVVKVDRERRRWIVERVTNDEGIATRYRCALEVFNEEDYYEHFWQDEVEAFEDTPALAICAAILEVAKAGK